MEDQEEDWDQSQNITFHLAGSILATMGFLPDKITDEYHDYKLFQEMWQMMEPEEGVGVKKDDIAYMLMVVRGMRDPSQEVDCEPYEERQGVARFIVFDQEGNLRLRKGGQIKIARQFRNFYINKLQAEATASHTRVARPAEDSAS